MKGFLKRLAFVFSPTYNNEIKKILSEMDERREDLDLRLKKLQKATLDGEEEWFLDMVKKKDPSCVLKIIEECENDK